MMNFEQIELFHPYTIALRKGRQALFDFDMKTAKINLAEAASNFRNSTVDSYIRATDFFQQGFEPIREIDNLKEMVSHYRNLWGEFETNPSHDNTLKTDLKKYYFRYIVSELEKYGQKKIIATLNRQDIYSIYREASCFRELYEMLLLMLDEKPDESQLVLMAANTSYILGQRRDSWIYYGMYCLLTDQTIDEGRVLDQDWRDLLTESFDEELSPAWVWIKARLRELFPPNPEDYNATGRMFLQKNFELLCEEYRNDPSNDKIASQLWFKTLQKAESGEDIIEHRKFLKQINPDMFEIYMKKKRGFKA